MNAQVVGYLVIVVGSILLGLQSFSRSRTYAVWAKRALRAVALIGIANPLCAMVVDFGWIALSDEQRALIARLCTFSAGVACGLIVALLLSLEIFGRKVTQSQP
jgi:hypothetical protein